MPIYDNPHISVDELLSGAGSEGKATFLIPNIQRPYVWEPRNVVLLMDSLLKGWPFGTLLTWKVSAEDPARGLARPFWRKVDRTRHGGGEGASQVTPPAEFKMVLDGQQRVQSLLLALGDNDEFGLQQFDWEWIKDKEGKGRSGPKRVQWVIGKLCVNIPELHNQYVKNKNIRAVDFTSVLEWVIIDDQRDISKNRKNDKILPLPLLKSEESKYIKLSQVLQKAPKGDPDREDKIYPAAQELLKEKKFSQEDNNKFKKSVAVLMEELNKVRKTYIHYLEIKDQRNSDIEEKEYNASIVNIFTRLNKAGRELKREDIILAWFKNCWDEEKTGDKNAQECIEELGKEIEEEKIESTDIIRGIGVIWSAAFGQGEVLVDSDLLKEEKIDQMVEDVCPNWEIFVEAITEVSSIAKEKGLIYRDQYNSLNALYYIWAANFIGKKWCNGAELKEAERDSFDRGLKETIKLCIDRWIMCSSWAGVWKSGTDKTVGKLAKELFDIQGNWEAQTCWKHVIENIRMKINNEIESLEEDAKIYIEGLSVSDPDKVRDYKNVLWIWNQLSKERWGHVQKPLRFSTKKPKVEVDHIFSSKIWEKCNTKLRKGSHSQMKHSDEELQSVINELGNCMLLEKNFNISKSDESLDNFLDRLDPYDKCDMRRKFYDAMDITPNLHSYKEPFSPDIVFDEINARTKKIKGDIIEFIKGNAVIEID